MISLPSLLALRTQPWRFFLINDVFSFSWGGFNHWAPPAIACLAFAIALVNPIRNWRASRKGVSLQSNRPAVSVVILLLLSSLFMTARSFFANQLIVPESGFGKIQMSADVQFELVLDGLRWIPGLLTPIAFVLLWDWTMRVWFDPLPTPRRLRISCAWLAYFVLFFGGFLPLSISVFHFASEGLALVAAFQDVRAVHWPFFLHRRDQLVFALSGFTVAAIIAFLLLVIPVVLTSWRNAAGSKGSSISKNALRWIGILACSELGLLFFWLTGPLTKEISDPIPIDHCFVNLGLGLLSPPAIRGVGPDQLRDGPTVEYRGVFLVDSVPADSPNGVRNILQNKREAWRQMYPRKLFPASVTVDLGRPLSIEKLQGALNSVSEARYSHLQFRLSHVLYLQRPFFGGMLGVRDSAVSLELTSSIESCAESSDEPLVLPSARWNTVDVLLGEVLAMRNRGITPCLIATDSICTDADCPLSKSEHVRVLRQTNSPVFAQRILIDNSEFDVVRVARPEQVLVLYADDQGKRLGSLKRLRSVLEESGHQVLMSMNAGAFDSRFRPMGLTISNRAVLAKLNLSEERGDFFQKPRGVFAVGHGTYVVPSIGSVLSKAHSKEDPAADFRGATQSGPLLMQNGKVIPMPSDAASTRAIRNAVGVSVRWNEQSLGPLFVVSNTPVTFQELIAVFSLYGATDVLQLDSGVSAMDLPVFDRKVPDTEYGPMIAIVGSQ